MCFWYPREYTQCNHAPPFVWEHCVDPVNCRGQIERRPPEGTGAGSRVSPVRYICPDCEVRLRRNPQGLRNPPYPEDEIDVRPPTRRRPGQRTEDDISPNVSIHNDNSYHYHPDNRAGDNFGDNRAGNTHSGPFLDHERGLGGRFRGAICYEPRIRRGLMTSNIYVEVPPFGRRYREPMYVQVRPSRRRYYEAGYDASVCSVQ